MKKLIIVAATVLSFPTMASDTCQIFSEIAHSVMVDRQNGVLLHKLLSEVNEAVTDKQVFGIIKDLAVAAYEVEIERSQELKKVAANEFANKAMISCINLSNQNKV
jgi:hypothetical protein